MNPRADFYFSKSQRWQKELSQLRAIVLDAIGLTEELKWGCPCYTYEGRNIVLIHEFKDYCALLFFKGALLKDSRGILVQQTANVQAARQARFTSVGEIRRLTGTLKAYIYEAIQAEEAGKKVPLKKTSELDMPEEFQSKLRRTPALKDAFKALTPGRQRGYLLYFAGAKQSKTRETRIEKCVPQILAGKGLND